MILRYLPLFYIDEYSKFKKKTLENKNDILFIGAWRNTERYHLIKLTEKFCTDARLKFYFYLHQSFWTQLVSIKEGIIPKEAKFRILSPIEILKLFSTSKTIIDFPSSFQTGLTMRTFETLGAGKKLITSNKNIAKEPFYDPEYISIIDVNNFSLDLDFIKKKPSGSMEEKIKNYSLENYIYKLLFD